ncbi:MAG: DUF3769 domain-containing protein, partial [Okeania sp.]|nr:DUF3769 domain-containing protein [Okeania sp.]
MSYPLPPPELPPIVETLPAKSVTKSITDVQQDFSTTNQKKSSPPSKFKQFAEEIRISDKKTFSGEEFRETVMYNFPEIALTFDRYQKVPPVQTTAASLGPPLEINISSVEKISTLENQVNSDRKKIFSSISFSDFSEYAVSDLSGTVRKSQTTQPKNLFSFDSTKKLESWSNTKSPISTKFQIEETTSKNNTPELPNLSQDEKTTYQTEVSESEDK